MVDWLNDIITSNKVTLETSMFRLGVSILIGGIIGYERQHSKHSAGFRTFTLICVGSTVMMLVSLYLPQIFIGTYSSDPTRVAGQVVTGIGFLGAGAIIQSRGAIKGMTTAASIWMVSALGLAIGAGMYEVSLVCMVVTLFVLINMAKFERKVMVEWTSKSITLTFEDLIVRKKEVEDLFVRHGLSVQDVFIEQEFDRKTTHLHFNVYVKIKTDYVKLFDDFQRLQSIVSVRLGA